MPASAPKVLKVLTCDWGDKRVNEKKIVGKLLWKEPLRKPEKIGG